MAKNQVNQIFFSTFSSPKWLLCDTSFVTSEHCFSIILHHKNDNKATRICGRKSNFYYFLSDSRCRPTQGPGTLRVGFRYFTLDLFFFLPHWCATTRTDADLQTSRFVSRDPQAVRLLPETRSSPDRSNLRTRGQESKFGLTSGDGSCHVLGPHLGRCFGTEKWAVRLWRNNQEVVSSDLDLDLYNPNKAACCGRQNDQKDLDSRSTVLKYRSFFVFCIFFFQRNRDCLAGARNSDVINGQSWRQKRKSSKSVKCLFFSFSLSKWLERRSRSRSRHQFRSDIELEQISVCVSWTTARWAAFSAYSRVATTDGARTIALWRRCTLRCFLRSRNQDLEFIYIYI